MNPEKIDDFFLEGQQEELYNWNFMDFQKMIFIYRAVQNGWTVKQLRNGKYEFHTNLLTREVYLEDYLKKFILFNMCLNHIQSQPGPNIPSNLIAQASDL